MEIGVFMGEREQGKVKWFNNVKGYGFITRDNAADIFVHYSAVQQEGYRSLREGQTVEYTVAQGLKGIQAEDVVVIKQPDRDLKKKGAPEAEQTPEAAADQAAEAPAEPIA